MGPLRIRGAGGSVTLTRRQEIGVLGLLALHAGTTVRPSALIDLLWPDDPPRTATKTLQGYIKRVRKQLGDNGVALEHTTPAGYLLQLSPAQVDGVHFESLVAAARTERDDDERIQRLDEALALWRGEPFAGCDLDGLRPFREWLVQLRSGARLERAAADVRRGITVDSLGALRALVTQEPTNERLWLHLAAALYLSGNPVGALTTVAAARRELEEQVGATPGPELLELEHRITVHDDVEGCYARLTGVVVRTDRIEVGGVGRTAAPPLPVWAGDLIGRDEEVAELSELIDAGTPVLTVTGPGGFGKTRCAAEAARRAGTRCDGLIDLSGIATAAEMALHLAGSIEAPGRDDPIAAIADRLAGRRCVVLLDNVEQIAGAADVVARLAHHCPSVTWLITSRTELGLDVERAVRLAPLAHEATSGGLSPATRLLIAAARRRGVEPGSEATPLLDRITAAIGGIPLALELAACQLRTLEPAALLRSLDDPLSTLVDHRRPVDRHRSMRACLELAAERLSPAAVTLLVVLSGRANGAPYDDVAAAWPASPALPGVLGELVDAGFAATGTDAAGATRISQLPIVRAFGRELTAPEDTAPLQAALDAAVLARAAAVTTGRPPAHLEPDLPDVRRLLQAGLDDDAALDRALGLAGGLVVYWFSHRLLEGRGWLDALLRRPAPPDQAAPSVHRLQALSTAAFLEFGVGDARSARGRLNEALDAGAPLVPPIHSLVLSRLAVLDAADSLVDRATGRAEESLRIARTIGQGRVLWMALGNGGDVAVVAGRPDRARELYLECIDQLRRSGLAWLSAAPCARLGDLELSAGHLAEAHLWYDRALSLWVDRTLESGAGQVLAGIARLALVEGRPDDARRHLDRGLAAVEAAGSRVEYPFLALGYAALAGASGDPAAGRALFAIALSHGRRAGVALGPMIAGELAGIHRATVGDHPDRLDETRALATPLEDVPMVIRQYFPAAPAVAP
ncbi:BTAD domain-containing putative transcriptional regulator [Nakamurella sp.]|uniref:AfsR/SARP family transcriptional regulator n=1 Tax=Nakamurella sp. TaxID=1869182 RepID=UPI003B3BE90B